VEHRWPTDPARFGNVDKGHSVEPGYRNEPGRLGQYLTASNVRRETGLHSFVLDLLRWHFFSP
jgi:hypothetical protein